MYPRFIIAHSMDAMCRTGAQLLDLDDEPAEEENVSHST